MSHAEESPSKLENGSSHFVNATTLSVSDLRTSGPRAVYVPPMIGTNKKVLGVSLLSSVD